MKLRMTQEQAQAWTTYPTFRAGRFIAEQARNFRQAGVYEGLILDYIELEKHGVHSQFKNLK
jgi:hypothetical protein